ncbi:hypothetical protein BDA96_05G216700 [Sorghum bicolor]|uniref:Uncharacterized protein n=2 Tax=Sorghum bicolor TaxID=4558 RepID=A0A921UI91_SORBI|nr:hypothetical protein BDA96_05G216700 [Sorghum bicolor]KXG29024.1 hypothetical protein SORBI_3005G200400 [Sorghum bicolor]
MRAECAVLCIVLVIMSSTTLTSSCNGVPTTISFHLPGCTFALCISECSVIAIRNGQVLQCSNCQKKDQYNATACFVTN